MCEHRKRLGRGPVEHRSRSDSDVCVDPSIVEQDVMDRVDTMFSTMRQRRARAVWALPPAALACIVLFAVML